MTFRSKLDQATEEDSLAVRKMRVLTPRHRSLPSCMHLSEKTTGIGDSEPLHSRNHRRSRSYIESLIST
jgi:hypothetical protein